MVYIGNSSVIRLSNLCNLWRNSSVITSSNSSVITSFVTRLSNLCNLWCNSTSSVNRFM